MTKKAGSRPGDAGKFRGRPGTFRRWEPTNAPVTAVTAQPHPDEVTMSTTAPPAEAVRISRPRPAPARTFGPLLLRLHFYAGIFVAPFLLLAALSGLAYAFSPQIDRI